MNDLFDSIKQGLTEAIEYERGNLPDVRVDKAENDAKSICAAWDQL